MCALKESGQETNLYNLKGELFERLMYHIIRMVSHGKIVGELRTNYHYNRIIDGKRIGYEYDMIAETTDEYIVFEFKGYQAYVNIPLGDYDEHEEKPKHVQ